MTTTVRFVHAADLHLGAPFRGVRAEEERVSEALVRAGRDAVRRIVTLAVDEDVDLVVVSGDVYDASRDLRAYMTFRRAAEDLAEHGIRVFVARGNHDPEDAWSAGLDLPENVTYFPSDRVARYEVEREGRVVCAVYGRSYRTRVEERNLAAGYRRGPDDPAAIAVLHANVGGREGYEPYAPCTKEDLRAGGMDYWALGHIHKPEVVSESPYAAYAGSPQGLDANETGPRGVRLVEISDGVVRERLVETHSVLWLREEVDVSGARDEGEVIAGLRERVEETRDAAGESDAVVRLTLTGTTPAHSSLTAGALTQIVEELREESLSRMPWLWIDRVKDETRAPVDLEEIAAGAGLDADLVRIAWELAEDEERAAQVVGEAAGALLDRLDDRTRPDPDPAAVIGLARDECLRRLGPEEA